MSASWPASRWSSLMSTPALNPRPAARRTPARGESSAPAAPTASASAYQSLTVSALTGGASTTTSTTPPSRRVVEIIRLPRPPPKHLLGYGTGPGRPEQPSGTGESARREAVHEDAQVAAGQVTGGERTVQPVPVHGHPDGIADEPVGQLGFGAGQLAG